MGCGARVLQLAALCLLAGPSLAAKKFSLTVGYLPSIKGDDGSRQGLSISGALSLAIEEINNSTEILPEVELMVEWNDTRSDTVIATRLLTDMSCTGVVAFFGPEGRCDTEAVIAQARNLPMITYRCPQKLTSLKPNLARLEPPNTMAAKSVISLLRYYRWHKFSILYEEAWVNVALTLENHAKRNNMTVNHQRAVIDGYKCCQDNLACCAPGFWFQFIQDTKNRTRIYVFLGSTTGLVEMMTAMESLQLFVKGEYMVVFVDMMTYSTKDALKYLFKTEERGKGPQQPLRCPVTTELRKRAQSLLVVVSSKPASGYEEFTDKVAKYNALKPFEFSIPPVIKETKFAKFVSIYAAYLYDSVKLYSKALDKLIREDLKSEPLTDEKLRSVATNGSRIVAKMIASSPYKSISGMSIRLDSRADSEGNFSVLAFKPTNLSDDEINCSCCYSMLPVGHFQQTNKEFPEYKLNRLPIDWPDSVKPEDEPSCGFENEKCPKDDSQITSLVVAGTLAVALFCALVVTASIYRRWKIDQEIEGLLWKIDPADVGLMGGGLVWSPSKLSLASGMSLESRCCPQIFAETAQYKGNVVRMKELKFSKKKDISRDVMKEMRLLRELRHDNLNSFIGAVVEPLRVCLLTDYCAKGSLYDIIENEDIKLDKMFISSLVHDLIKGMMFIHTSPLQYHGNLKSSNCVVTTRWMLQVADFGLHELRYCAENEYIGEHQYYRGLLWKSPELLRQLDDPNGTVGGTQKGDIYAFAVILYELIGRRGPFGLTSLEPKDIVERVKRPKSDSEELFRPDTTALEGLIEPTDEYVVACMRDCWAEDPAARPDFPMVRSRLKKMRAGKSRNVMDQMMDMLEKYANNLEDLVNERTRLLNEEKQKTEDLLHRMLPKSVAERLTTGEGVEPESFDSVTIYFSDIVGFTAMSAESSPLQVVNFLNDLYTVFDRVIRGYDVYKVETIGDAYMVVSGLPLRNNDRHVGEIASMALELLSAAKAHRISHRPTELLKLRIGIHTGAVVAGVVGLTMPRYCLFGDTVNTASRMESTGEPLKIHISPSCKEALDRIGGYVVESRGVIPIKGKGEITTYWLTGATAAAVQKRAVDSDERPLFCRPRRSPRLTDSRQPSLTDPSDLKSDSVWPGGGGGGSSVRQRLTSVPRSCGDSSGRDERGSRASLPGARSSPVLRRRTDQGTRNKQALSTIASSTACCSLAERRGRTQSLDVLPRAAPSAPAPLPTVCSRAPFNGTIMALLADDFKGEGSPLLLDNSRKKKQDASYIEFYKKWRSLENVDEDKAERRKPARLALGSWLLGLLGGASRGGSDASLRRAAPPLLNTESVV